MKQFLGLVLAVAATCSIAAAATQPERVRGTVADVSATALTVHPASGSDVSLILGSDTKYLKVVPSSLDKIEPGSYIGTATKNVGDKLVALEVVIFPPSMKGTGDGHYPWDKIPDTTLSGGARTASSMTNGSVAAVSQSGSGPEVKSSMTNGGVAAVTAKGSAKQLKVTYKGGEQTILVPPTAPIVTFQPGAMADVKPGASVFVIATADGGKITAHMVAVGADGVKPPM